MIRALVERGARSLTVIANDTARPGVGIGLLISAGCVSKAIVSHIGTNPETQARMIAGEIAVELVPQGTLVERIRAAGAGLGGVLTPTGVGTLAAEGKQTLELERPGVPAGAGAAGRLRAGRGAERGLHGQPRLFADRAELQPADGAGGRPASSPSRTRSSRWACCRRTRSTRRAWWSTTSSNACNRPEAAMDSTRAHRPPRRAGAARQHAGQPRDRAADPGGELRAAGDAGALPVGERHHRLRRPPAGGHGGRAPDRRRAAPSSRRSRGRWRSIRRCPSR